MVERRLLINIFLSLLIIISCLWAGFTIKKADVWVCYYDVVGRQGTFDVYCSSDGVLCKYCIYKGRTFVTNKQYDINYTINFSREES